MGERRPIGQRPQPAPVAGQQRDLMIAELKQRLASNQAATVALASLVKIDASARAVNNLLQQPGGAP